MRVTTHLLLIGPEEIHRVLAVGDDAEAEALICYMRVMLCAVMLYVVLCYIQSQSSNLGVWRAYSGRFI
jgi:hypothetical protein